MKKARGKRKGTAKTSAKKSAKKSVPRTKKPVDLVRVRENINNLVGASAEEIATGVIKVAKAGQLTSAKYLFEAVGLYPATEQTAARPVENTLAHTLLRRLGLPLDPVICDEDLAPAVLPSVARELNTETAVPSVVEEDPEGEREEDLEPTPAESEESMERIERKG